MKKVIKRRWWIGIGIALALLVVLQYRPATAMRASIDKTMSTALSSMDATLTALYGIAMTMQVDLATADATLTITYPVALTLATNSWSILNELGIIEVKTVEMEAEVDGIYAEVGGLFPTSLTIQTDVSAIRTDAAASEVHLGAIDAQTLGILHEVGGLFPTALTTQADVADIEAEAVAIQMLSVDIEAETDGIYQEIGGIFPTALTIQTDVAAIKADAAASEVHAGAIDAQTLGIYHELGGMFPTAISTYNEAVSISTVLERQNDLQPTHLFGFTGADGTVAYTSSRTLTVAGAPFTVDSANCRILFVWYRSATGPWKRLTNGQNGVDMTATANVVTVSHAGAIFAATDTNYLIGVYQQPKGYTVATTSNRVEEISPVPQHYIAVQTLVAAASPQAFTTSWADMGGEVDCRSYTQIALYLTLDINDGDGLRVRALYKHTTAGAEEYQLPLYTPSSTDVTVDDSYYEFTTTADQLIVVHWDCDNTIPYVQFQIQADHAGATAAQVDAAYYTLGYGK